MYTRYYDSYPSNIHKSICKPEVTKKEEKHPSVQGTISDIQPKVCNDAANIINTNKTGLKLDDLLLTALLFITATTDDEDFLMPLILGALLIG